MYTLYQPNSKPFAHVRQTWFDTIHKTIFFLIMGSDKEFIFRGKVIDVYYKQQRPYN